LVWAASITPITNAADATDKIFFMTQELCTRACPQLQGASSPGLALDI